MFHGVAGAIFGTMVLLLGASVGIGLLSATFDYLSEHKWPLWTLAGVVGGAALVSHEGLWGYLWEHAGMVLLLPAPLAAAGWLALTGMNKRAKCGPGDHGGRNHRAAASPRSQLRKLRQSTTQRKPSSSRGFTGQFLKPAPVARQNTVAFKKRDPCY